MKNEELRIVWAMQSYQFYLYSIRCAYSRGCDVTPSRWGIRWGILYYMLNTIYIISSYKRIFTFFTFLRFFSCILLIMCYTIHSSDCAAQEKRLWLITMNTRIIAMNRLLQMLETYCQETLRTPYNSRFNRIEVSIEGCGASVYQQVKYVPSWRQLQEQTKPCTISPASSSCTQDGLI